MNHHDAFLGDAQAMQPRTQALRHPFSASGSEIAPAVLLGAAPRCHELRHEARLGIEGLTVPTSLPLIEGVAAIVADEVPGVDGAQLRELVKTVEVHRIAHSTRTGC